VYYPEADLFLAKPHVQAPSGAWNILNALKQGYESGANVIHLIEEDVMVSSGYFEQSWALLEKYDVVCGRRIPNFKEFSGYTNPGAAWSRRALGLLVPHINDSFFADRAGYLEREFGRIEGTGELDDGLIQHVIPKHGLTVCYPDRAIVAHQGFHYYGRLPQFKVEGSIQERIEKARELLSRVDNQDRYSRDFEVLIP